MKASIIAIDCPWEYPQRNNPHTKFGKGMHGYPGMTREEIIALPVKDIAAPDCALFFWVVPTQIKRNYIPLQIMFECFEAWEFRLATKAFCWVKLSKSGRILKRPGHYTASNTEDCYIAIRGKMPVVVKMLEQPILTTPQAHSAKPGKALERMRLMYPHGHAVELFARSAREGWACLGNEIDGQSIQESMRAFARAAVWTSPGHNVMYAACQCLRPNGDPVKCAKAEGAGHPACCYCYCHQGKGAR